MKNKIELLLDKMDSYVPGDLIAQVEIIELLNTLSAETSEDEQAYFQGILKRFKEITLSGKEKDYEELSAICKGLAMGLKPKPEENSAERAETRIYDLELLSSFLQESNDHLESIEDKILSLERVEDPDLINSIFRSMHTIKGVASFIGLGKIKTLTHDLESLLDKLRQREVYTSTEVIDLLLAGSDEVKKSIARIDELFPRLSPGVAAQELEEESDFTDLSLRIRALLEEQKKSVKPPEEFPEDLITPELLERFVAESSDLLDSTEQSIIQMEKEPENTSLLGEAFRSIHTIKGNAGFFWFKGIERICMEIETVLDLLRKDSGKAGQEVISSLLSGVDSIRKRLSKIAKGDARSEQQEEGSAEARSGEAVEGEKGYEPLGEILLNMGAISREEVDKALDRQQMKLGEILVEEGAVSRELLDEALVKQGKTSENLPDQFSAYTAKRKDIRVDTNRLDRLFDLMGELITAEAVLIGNPELEKYEIPGFERAASYLSKITRELQEITLAIRMIPLEGLFNKMRRLVRDLSRKFGKKVNLTVTGEETEMDRNVIEEISDPLVHIIRNSIDHGIEERRIRLERAKDPVGLISLNARYEGNEIWISVKDDGGGLNRDKILKTAEERGIIRNLETPPPDAEIWALIFEPGFSTADKISEISGRGVGMDVVKKNIEKLRGKIDIVTTPGSGTEIILKIPLTLAIIDGVTLRVGRMLYSIPISDILEFHKSKPGQITSTARGYSVLHLRSETIPIIKLFQFFNIEPEKKNDEEPLFILVHSMNRKAALQVDEILGYYQVVIKALPEYISGIRAISGCTIMGDGRVSLILDIGSLFHSEFE